jgi:hypothetical protein
MQPTQKLTKIVQSHLEFSNKLSPGISPLLPSNIAGRMMWNSWIFDFRIFLERKFKIPIFLITGPANVFLLELQSCAHTVLKLVTHIFLWHNWVIVLNCLLIFYRCRFNDHLILLFFACIHRHNWKQLFQLILDGLELILKFGGNSFKSSFTLLSDFFISVYCFL